LERKRKIRKKAQFPNGYPDGQEVHQSGVKKCQQPRRGGPTFTKERFLEKEKREKVSVDHRVTAEPVISG